MSNVAVQFGPDTYILTDEHASANHGQPVLLGPNGVAYGPWDIAHQGPDLPPNFAGEIVPGTQWYARAIASFIRDDAPDDAEAIALLRRFESVLAAA